MKTLSASFLLTALLLASPLSARAADGCGTIDGWDSGAYAKCVVCHEADNDGKIRWNVYATNRKEQTNGVIIRRSEAIPADSAQNTSYKNMSDEMLDRLSRTIGMLGNSGLCYRDTAGTNSQVYVGKEAPAIFGARPKQEKRTDPRDEE